MSAAPRRPRSPATRGLWQAVAVGALALAGWMAGLAALLASTWTAPERAEVAALLAPRAALLVLGWLAGTALVGAGLHWLWRRHVQPSARLAEDAQALLATPDAPPLPVPGGAPALRALATAFNSLRAQGAAHRADLQAQIDQASARVAGERNHLAALLAQLAQGVVVCNLDGDILLYNPRARLQLRALSHAPVLADGADVVGIGRSIYGAFDRAQVRHALARVQARPLGPGGAPATAQFVTATHGGRLLRVQLAPVLDSGPDRPQADEPGPAASPACTGFMLTLDDVTRAFDAAAERDRWLAEATGQSGAAVAVLARMLAELAPPDGGDAWRAARAQCEILRAHVAAQARHAAEGLATRWPLEDMLAADLLEAARHHLARAQPVRLAVEPAPDELWLRVDSYLVLEALASLAVRLADALPLRFIGLRLTAADDGSAHAWLDLFWDGLPISTQTVMTWELEPVGTGTGAQYAMLTLRDVLDRHRATLAFGRDRRRHEAFLRFVLPLASPADAPTASLPAPAPTGGRPEFYDFDLFQTRPHQGTLDEQPLAALAYTVFDTETTGLNPSAGDQIIQIGATRIVNGRLLRQESWEQLIDPGRPISADNSAIHGISNDMVRGQPRIAEVLPAFHAFAQGTVLVAHNAAFDMKFLQLQERATGLVFDQPVLDTLLLATVVLPQQPSHRLDALVQRFGIGMQGARHTALADALATAQVLLHLIPLLQARGIETLGQARAAARQSYLARLRY